VDSEVGAVHGDERLGHDLLDVVLKEREPVVVAGGKVADVQRDHREPRNLHGPSPRKEPISDSTLIENLDRSRVQTPCARAFDVRAGAPLHDPNVDSGQRQLARQHHPCRTTSGDHHCMLGHGHLPSDAPRSALILLLQLEVLRSRAKRQANRIAPATYRPECCPAFSDRPARRLSRNRCSAPGRVSSRARV
jgi:hypothetical protein